MYSNNCTTNRYNNIQPCGKPPTRFSLFRPSSGSYSTKKNIFLCWMPPWRWPKHVGRVPRLYIIVSNYSTVASIHMVTCLTAWNRDNTKFDPYIFQSAFQFWWQLYQRDRTRQNRHAMHTFPNLLYLHHLLRTVLLFHLPFLWVQGRPKTRAPLKNRHSSNFIGLRQRWLTFLRAHAQNGNNFRRNYFACGNLSLLAALFPIVPATS
jgi:hypothetical protein